MFLNPRDAVISSPLAGGGGLDPTALPLRAPAWGQGDSSPFLL